MSGSRSLNLGAEHCNRVVTSTRGVELITVRAYCYRMDNKKSVNTSKAVPLDIHEDKSPLAGSRLNTATASDRSNDSELNCDSLSDVTLSLPPWRRHVVRTDSHRRSTGEPVDSTLAVPVNFDESEVLTGIVHTRNT